MKEKKILNDIEVKSFNFGVNYSLFQKCSSQNIWLWPATEQLHILKEISSTLDLTFPN